jgi:transketolase
LDLLSVDPIGFLSVGAVQKANSGDSGLPLGAVPMADVLWTRFLQHNPANRQWFNSQTEIQREEYHEIKHTRQRRKQDAQSEG